MAWDEIAEGLSSQEAKKKLEAISQLKVYLDETTITQSQLREVLGYVCQALEDNNIKVCQGGLQLTACFLDITETRHDFRSFTPSLLAAVADKLGDAKQGIRLDACQLLVRIARRCGSIYLLERATESGLWCHKNWRIRQGIASVGADLCSQFGLEGIGDEERHKILIEPCVGLLEDPNSSVRDAAVDCMGEIHSLMGTALMEALDRYTIRPATRRELASKFDNTCPAPLSNPRNTQQRSSSVREKKPVKQSSAVRGPAGTDADGSGLPQVEPIPVETDRELKEEVDRIITGLALSEEWDNRILAMGRLEGLVMGGAARLDSFCDVLKSLKDSLTAQINDRRSAVSRLACHAVATMAAALGNRFEVEAVYFLPVVFKVLIITVQVMAEAADLCVHSILHYCKSGRLVPKICEVLISDRNAKSRQHCSKFLLQVLEEWPKSIYERQMEHIENAIKCASQDTNSDTRSTGRLAFGAYSRACPDRAKAFLKRLDAGLQQKLLQSLGNYQPGSVLFPAILPLPEHLVADTKRPAHVQLSLTNTPQTSKSHKHATSPLTKFESPQQSAAHHTGPTAFLTPITEASTKSSFQDEMMVDNNGVGEMTWPLASMNTSNIAYDNHAEASGREPRLSTYGAPQRCQTEPRNSQGARSCFDGTPQSFQSVRSWNAVTDEEMLDAGPNDTLISKRSEGAALNSQTPRGSMESKTLILSRLLAESANQSKTDWQSKLEVLDRVYELLEGSNWPPGQLNNEAYRMAQFFQLKIEDAHFRVVDKALSTFVVAVDCVAQIFEAYLDRLMPLLFHKLVDQKDLIQKQAKYALEGISQNYSADVLLPAMIRSLESIKMPRGIASVLEYSCLCLGQDTPAGIPSVSSVVRQWVSRVLSYISDKNAEVRRLAVNALHNVYQNMDSSTILAHLSQASPQEQALLRRVLGALLPDAQVPEARQPGSSQRPKPTSTTPRNNLKRQAETVVDRLDENIGNPTTSHRFMDSTVLEKGGSWQKENSSLRNSRNLDVRTGIRDEFDSVVEEVLSEDLTMGHLRQVMLLVKKFGTNKWGPAFDKVLRHLMSDLASSDNTKIEQVLVVIKGLLMGHGSLLQQNLVENMVHNVLACTKTSSGLVLLAVDEVLLEIMTQESTTSTFSLMANILSESISVDIPEDAEKSTVMRCCIESLSQLFQKMHHRDVSKVFPGNVLESLVTAWKSPNVEVRKAVVCCLANACFKMGLRATEFMGPLSASQAKLLEIYIKKTEDGHQQLGF